MNKKNRHISCLNTKYGVNKSKNLSFLVFIILIISSLNFRAQCNSNATSTGDEDIFNVTFGTLNNSSTCSSTGGGAGSIQSEYSNYAFAGFAGSVPNIDRGCTIPFSIQIGTCGGNYNNAIAIYIDWNNDADFVDVGEKVYNSATSTSGPHTETGSITVPGTATLGNCKIRVVNVETATPSSINPCGTYSWGETEDYFVNITNGGGIAPYVSSSVTQLVSGGVSQCATLQQIICIPVVMGAGCTTGALTQLQLGAGSSTNLLADVSKIHVFYTGTSNVYTASSEFVAGGTVPSGATNTINGSQALVPNATNYFWVTYDMNNASTIGDLIDGSCAQITVGGINQIPSTTNPAGSGTITTCPCSFSLGSDVNLCPPFTYTINGPVGFDTYSWTPGGATTQNLSVSAPGTYTCNATLINGGLVVNGDFSSGNNGFSSSYILGTGGTWGPVSNAGTYSVTNNANAAHSNFLSFGDHTTGTGNMMICNGADIANTIVWSQTIIVTPNTNYNFSAWFASVANDAATSVAQLQFSINGILIGPVSTAPLTGGVWSNFFVNWNSGSSTSAIITIVDQRITGNNDFALDDISFERICTFSDAITIMAGSTTSVSVPTNTAVCNNTPIAASSFTSNPAGATFSWSNSNTAIGLASSGNGNTPTFTAINTGTSAITSVITVTPSSGGCPGIPNSYTITVNPNPILSVNSPTTCSGIATLLTANGATGYTWSTGATTSTINPSPSITTVYTVTGTTAGCSGTTTSTVSISSALSIAVNNPTICSGTSTVLTASGATNYTWSTGATTSTISVSPTGTTNYSVTGNSSGCVGTNTSIVTVNATPTLSVNSPTICSGTSTVLTANGATNYTWSTGATTPTISVSPTSTTNYSVTGNSSGCFGTNTSIVTVNTTPTISVNNATICSGTSTVLTANGATNYTWSTGATTPTISVSPTSITNYTVTGNSLGCTGTNTSIVTVNTTPTISVNNPTICSGTSTVLTASGASNYTWSTGATTPTISVSPTSTTNYTVTGHSLGCAGTNTSIVTVNAIPTVTVNNPTTCSGISTLLTAVGATTYSWNTGATTSTISVSPTITTIYTVTGTTNGCSGTNTSTVTVNAALSVSVNNATICAGTTTVLTAGGATNYTWSTGATTSSISVSPSSTTVYSLTGETLGCTGSTTATVTVNAIPTVTVNNASICSGTSTVLTAGGATTYLWDTGATTSTISVSPTSITVYTVTGTTNGCSGNNTTTVTVNVVPIVTLTPTSATICAGQSAVLNASGATTYTWLPTGSGTTSTVTPTSTTIYTVTGSIGSCTSIPQTATVNVNAIPVITIAASPTAICAGQTAIMSSTTSIPGGTFAWLPNNQTTSSVSESPTTTTNYTVTYSVGGCTTSATSTITVNATPTVSVNSVSICAGQTATLTAIPSISGGSFVWAPNGEITPIISSSPNTTSNYSLLYTLNGCTTTVSSSIIVTPNPVLILTPSSGTVSPLDEVIISATGGNSYTWNMGQTGSSITVNPSQTTTYCATVTTIAGCMNTACIEIIVADESTLYIPNSFTPNGDGLNDIYVTPNHNIKTYDLKIFNRWGQLLFSSTDPLKGWDGNFGGNIIPNGVYVYVLKAEGTDNVIYNKAGHITVLQ